MAHLLTYLPYMQLSLSLYPCLLCINASTCLFVLLTQLRQQMIDQKEGETDFRSKKHFDSMVSVDFVAYL